MSVVITGGTRGIGRGLAEEFVKRGHDVVISGRNSEAAAVAAAAIEGCGPGHAVGMVADVSNLEQLQALWQLAAERFGTVDIWVNNAGITHPKQKLEELAPDKIAEVAQTNLTGLAYGCKVAIAGMLAQGHGKIFNMEGFGSDGMTQEGMSIYGATKAAVRYVTKSLVKEYADSPLVIANLSPGIVVTEFVTRDLYAHNPDELTARKKLLSLLADRVETVAPALVDGMLGLEQSGGAVRWMTTIKALGRVVSSPFRKRDPFADPAA